MANGYFADSAGNAPLQRIAENFTLGTGTAIGQVGAWGVYFPNNIMIDNYTVNFYADSGNYPGALLHSVGGSASSVDTGVDAFGSDVYESTITLNSAFNAAAGTQYWVSITNSTGLGSDWAWITATADFVGRWSPDAGASWLDLGSDLSLRLYEVPAPSSLALLGLGGLIAGRRRR
jgi:hypothetical protein